MCMTRCWKTTKIEASAVALRAGHDRYDCRGCYVRASDYTCHTLPANGLLHCKVRPDRPPDSATEVRPLAHFYRERRNDDKSLSQKPDIQWGKSATATLTRERHSKPRSIGNAQSVAHRGTRTLETGKAGTTCPERLRQGPLLPVGNHDRQGQTKY